MTLSAVLFDRDGTVIFDRHYLSDPAGVELIPGTGEALARLGRAGIASYLVSNQSGIGRGYVPESAWYACQERLDELLAQKGAKLEDTRFCPHAPEVSCSCRKPGTGMWESLREAHGLDASSCAMVGDKPEDLRFGINAGLAAAVLVLTGFMAYALVKWLKNREKASLSAKAMAGCWTAYTLLAGVCIALEFAVDKAAWLPVWACYSLMAVCVAAMGLCAYKVLFQREKN